MADILHRVGIKAPLDQVYKALATRDGLAAWWTTNTQGDSRVGGTLQFRFSAGGAEIGGSTKWAMYLMSLKALLESGAGAPNPNDTHISGDGPD